MCARGGERVLQRKSGVYSIRQYHQFLKLFSGKPYFSDDLMLIAGLSSILLLSLPSPSPSLLQSLESIAYPAYERIGCIDR